MEGDISGFLKYLGEAAKKVADLYPNVGLVAFAVTNDGGDAIVDVATTLDDDSEARRLIIRMADKFREEMN